MGDVPHVASEVEPNCTELLIVRHGETFWNETGRLQGQAESDLNAKGLQQAEALATRLRTGEFPFTAVYSSDLKRAKDTADTIASASGKGPVTTLPGLRERHLGALQGLTTKEAQLKEPETLEAFWNGGQETRIPGGGESAKDVQRRVSQTLEDISATHRGERVLVVCHGGVLHAIYTHATEQPFKGKVVNAAINVLKVSKKGGWSIGLWGDTSHLEGVGYLAQSRHIL